MRELKCTDEKHQRLLAEKKMPRSLAEYRKCSNSFTLGTEIIRWNLQVPAHTMVSRLDTVAKGASMSLKVFSLCLVICTVVLCVSLSVLIFFGSLSLVWTEVKRISLWVLFLFRELTHDSVRHSVTSQWRAMAIIINRDKSAKLEATRATQKEAPSSETLYFDATIIQDANPGRPAMKHTELLVRSNWCVRSCPEPVFSNVLSLDLRLRKNLF